MYNIVVLISAGILKGLWTVTLVCLTMFLSFYSLVSEIDWLTVDALRQVLNLRDSFDFLFFFSTLLDSELDSLILYLASSCTL